tara:strand:- start:412 stop:1029 length:618 start_codon:yes stop_codon:yes gene_type:complete
MTKQQNTKPATDTTNSGVTNTSTNPKDKSIKAKPHFMRMIENVAELKAKDGKSVANEIQSEFEFMWDNIPAQFDATGANQKPDMVQFLEKVMDSCAESYDTLQNRYDWRSDRINELNSDESGFTTKVSKNDEITVQKIRYHSEVRDTIQENMEQIMYLGTLFAKIALDMCPDGIKLSCKLDRWNSYGDMNQSTSKTHAIKRRKRN